jgi:hypothetical protein
MESSTVGTRPLFLKNGVWINEGSGEASNSSSTLKAYFRFAIIAAGVLTQFLLAQLVSERLSQPLLISLAADLELVGSLEACC